MRQRGLEAGAATTIDMVGRVIGRLTVLARARSVQLYGDVSAALFLCRCRWASKSRCRASGCAGARGRDSRCARRSLARILRKSRPCVRLNEHLEHPDGLTVFQHACKMGLEGIVSKRLGSRYRSGSSPDWLKFKNPEAPAVRREAEEDWGR